MDKIKYKIREIGKDFGDAPFGTSLKTKDYTESGIPVVQGQNIVDQQFEWNRKLYVSEDKFNSLKRSHCRAGDLIFPKIGNRTVGSAAIAKEIEGHRVYLLSTNMMKMSVNHEIAELKYVYYYFCLPKIREYIVSTAGGGAQPIFNFTTLKNFEIELPDLSLQRKIAAILLAYDDLIENNNRRIKILEEMAQTIYKEWFVNFRFPGHEKIKMVKSELGMIPEGWEVKTINDFVSIKSGFAFKGRTFDESGIYGLVTIKNVQDGKFISECHNRIQQLPSNLPAYCLLKTGDILFSLTGNIGRVCLVVGEDYLLNQRVAKLEPQEDSNRAYTYFTFHHEEMKKKLENISTGVAQKNLSPIETGRQEIVLPPVCVLSNFAEICGPILDEILVLFQRNDNLHKTRDLLLPKLISGEVDVEGLDIEISEESSNA